MGEDLPRAGRLERVEVEREEPPEAVCREAEQHAPPDLAIGRGAVDPIELDGLAGVAGGHAPTVQVSLPARRASMSASVTGPVRAEATCSRSRSS